ncbi:MAG: MBL fold metallo-hydrolase [Candidatus Poseidoniales archaeon]
MVEVVLLGSAQDGGVPQVGCRLDCCRGQVKVRYPTSIGLTDSDGGHHLFEATRHLGEQLRIWNVNNIDTVFLTHAHFGHVDGLGLFGPETMNSKDVSLYCSNEMTRLIEQTPNWNILIEQGVFKPQSIQDVIHFPGVSIEAIKIPHRNELSDMHAFLIKGEQTLLFLPDHDTWDETLRGEDLRSWLNRLDVDIALLDGTFFSADELEHRDQKEIPHPPVKQTLEMLGMRKNNDCEIIFIHLNHTNPLCKDDSAVTDLGWAVGFEGQRFQL